ncbi:hypothetical protein TKK_0016404 [Trichogramma kaykai]
MDYRSMPPEYFCKKMNAVYIINLVDYLNKNKITEENLDNEDILKDIIQDKLDPVIVKSTRSFFRSSSFFKNKPFFETVRSYLNTLNIDEEEKLYIKNASIQLINNTKTFNNVPLQKNIIIMNQEYFRKKKKRRCSY